MCVFGSICCRIDGDVVTQTWSIGGPYPRSVLSAIRGQPQGISYSHNKYEGDSSATRSKAYLANGDAYSLVKEKFEHLYNLGAHIHWTRSVHKINRKLSESTNPYYFSAPFSGILVAPAAHNFIINFMSNHTAENPDGYLDKAQLKTFFGISGPENALVWNKAQEQTPQNWGSRYRRFDWRNIQLGQSFERKQFGMFCNSSYAAGLSDTLKTLLSDVSPALDLVNKFAAPSLGHLSCPALAVYNQGVFNQFPGYKYDSTIQATNYKD